MTELDASSEEREMALPSREEAERLIGFLPDFTEPNRSFVKNWKGGVDETAGPHQMPYPAYANDVIQFFDLIAGSE